MRSQWLLILMVGWGAVSYAAEKHTVIFTAPWGNGYGQYGQMVSPTGERSGPQSFCTSDDGVVFVLDTYNDGRVHVYNTDGMLMPPIVNKFPSLGYADIIFEPTHYLFLLDRSRSVVNRMDLKTGEQKLITGTVLGASGEIWKIGLDLRDRAYVEDQKGNCFAFHPAKDNKVLTPLVLGTQNPFQKIATWKNTKLHFKIGARKDVFPLNRVEFLRLLPGGLFYFDIETKAPQKVYHHVKSFDNTGWTKTLVLLKPKEFDCRTTRTSWVDKNGIVYQMLLKAKDVRVIKWPAPTDIKIPDIPEK